jgi:hypothetical protein
MYEYMRSRGGLGWSDYLVDGEYQTCDQVVGGVKKCFTTTSQDETCARNSGCFALTERCTTTSRGSGNVWCCPRDLPPPPGMPCLPQSTAMVCQRHAIRCATLENDDQYATCRVQKALCDQGVDPGPIDGRGDSNMFPIAVRMYKSRNGISPANDDISDTRFLEALGVVGDDRVRRGSGQGDRPPGSGLPPGVTNWFWPIAFSLSSVFLGVSWWKYGRR